MSGGGFNDEIAGGIGTLIRLFLQSANFETGVAGWQIKRDGDVEFNQGIFRVQIIIGDPGSGPGAEIGPTLPAPLPTYYAGQATSVADFAIVIYPDANDYHYEIVGLGTGSDLNWMNGWYDSANAAVREMENQRLFPSTGDMFHLFSARQTKSQTTNWVFGQSWGAARTPANSHNQMQLFDTQFELGNGASTDTGSMVVAVPVIIFTATTQYQVNVPSALFTGAVAVTNGLSVSGSTSLAGTGNIAADLTVNAILTALGGLALHSNLNVTGAGDIQFAGNPIGRGIIYREQLVNVATSGTGLAEQIWFGMTSSATFPNNRAFRIRISGLWTCTALNNPRLAIRETNITGTQLCLWGHEAITNTSSDQQLDIVGEFVNTSGGSLTKFLELTIALSVATAIRFDGAAAPQVSYWEIEDIGPSSKFPGLISVT